MASTLNNLAGNSSVGYLVIGVCAAYLVYKVYDGASSAISNIPEAIGRTFNGAVDTVLSTPGKMLDVVGDVTTGAVETGRSFFEKIYDWHVGVINSARNEIDDIFSTNTGGYTGEW